MPLIAPFKFIVLRMDWGNDRIAPTVQTPVLYLAGDSDELVPHNHMTELFMCSQKASDYAQMHIIRGGTHNDSWMVGGREYFEKFRAFMSHIMLNEKNVSVGVGGAGAGTMGTDFNNVDGVGGATSGSESVEVNMGEEGTISIERSAIPIMPKNFVGIAKEASKMSTDMSDKKKS